MKYLLVMALLSSLPTTKTIFNFNKKADISRWIVINDSVMGGVSSGSFSITSEGFGLFQGATSLKNNGGFSSVHFSFTKKDISEYSKICIKLKGDGRKYQFRIKTQTTDDHSYIKSFVTSGKWENIEINLQDMYPGFRGKKLEKKNFSSDHIEQVTFLIGNKKEEKFKLLLDEIILK